MKTKIVAIAVLLLSGSFSHAGFDCQHSEVSVKAVHESKIHGFKDSLGKVLIATAEKDEVQMSAKVGKWNTRAGSQYNYQLPVEAISFSVSEFSHLVTNSGCKPGGRVTCDYDWSSSYVGYLTFNGKSYELDCKVL